MNLTPEERSSLVLFFTEMCHVLVRDPTPVDLMDSVYLCLICHTLVAIDIFYLSI